MFNTTQNYKCIACKEQPGEERAIGVVWCDSTSFKGINKTIDLHKIKDSDDETLFPPFITKDYFRDDTILNHNND